MMKIQVIFGIALVPLAVVSVVSCGSDETMDGATDAGPVAEYQPPESHLQRLTRTQYRNAIHDIFGGDIVLPPKLEPDESIEGLIAVATTRTSISPRGVEQYEAAAYEIASQVMGSASLRDSILPCSASAGDAQCARAACAQLGRRVWRRPLTDSELDRLEAIAMTASERLGDFVAGFEFAIAALLQSPNFLFRSELGEDDPENPGLLRYSNYEMASRLSFFLWNSTPDQELLDAAGRGELTNEDGLRQQAQRLLTSDRARAAVRNFFAEMFELHELDGLVKDPTIFTHMSPDLGPAAREETLRTIEHLVFEENGDYRDVMTNRRTFLNRKLASLYNVRATKRDGFFEHTWDKNSPRQGLLGHASILSLHAHAVSSSATLRGKFVRQKLLCATILPPPVDVDTSLPEPSGNTLTLRDRVKEHLVDPACNGCHRFMDPIGLGLENFDGLGRFRRTDHGAQIDATGELDGEFFSDAVDLGQRVRSHPDLAPCLVRTMFRYATGEVEDAGDEETLAGLNEQFARNGFRVLPLMLEIVTNRGFRQATAAPGKGDA